MSQQAHYTENCEKPEDKKSTFKGKVFLFNELKVQSVKWVTSSVQILHRNTHSLAFNPPVGKVMVAKQLLQNLCSLIVTTRNAIFLRADK